MAHGYIPKVKQEGGWIIITPDIFWIAWMNTSAVQVMNHISRICKKDFSFIKKIFLKKMACRSSTIRIHIPLTALQQGNHCYLSPVSEKYLLQIKWQGG